MLLFESDPEAPLARCPQSPKTTKMEVLGGVVATVIICLSLSIFIGVLVWMAQAVWAQVLG